VPKKTTTMSSKGRLDGEAKVTSTRDIDTASNDRTQKRVVVLWKVKKMS
jgi:hypothetical protein